MEAEVLIIGGGIVGASTAFALAQHGRRVVLLERGDIASEASGVNAGHIGALGWGDAPVLESHLTMGSLDMFKSLQLDMGYDIEFRQCGGLEAAQTDAQMEYAQKRVRILTDQGYTVELLGPRQAASIEPGVNPMLPGFIYAPLRGKANPVLATRALAHAAEQQGARIFPGHGVTAIGYDGRSYTVETGHGEFVAERLVIAAGAWSAPIGRMLGLRVPIVPVRGQMWATAPMAPTMFHALSSAESYQYWSECSASGESLPPNLTHEGGLRITRHLYGSQTRSGAIAFGGDRQVVDSTGATSREGVGLAAEGPNAEGIEANRGHAAEVVPMLAQVPIERTWAGLMPFSLDGAPIIGRIPQREGLYIASGLASSGFGRGPMAGKLLADYLHTGRMPAVLSEADPARCVTEDA